MSLEKIKSDRLNKLENIKKAKINLYPSKTGPKHLVAEILDDFDVLEKKETEVPAAIVCS